MKETTVVQISESFVKEHIPTASLRTIPYDTTGSETPNKILQAVALMSKNNNAHIKVDDVYSKLTANTKTTDDTHKILAMMTAEPFPLILSQKEEGSNVEDVPLYNIIFRKETARKYSRVKLSPLGEMATRHYKNEEMSSFKYHKSIIPISLFKASVPWIPGHKATFYPLNPEELFKLMIKMIEYNSMNVTDNDLKTIFRGFDLGEGYTISMSSDSLVLLYTAGKSSISISPSVRIDRANKSITFLRPPYRKSMQDLKVYLVDRFTSEQHFKTFRMSDNIEIAGMSLQLKNVNFLAKSDNEIIKEIIDNKFITVTDFLVHTSLVPKPRQEDIDGGYQQFKNDDFNIDIVPVNKTLWKHIHWELEQQKITINKKILKLEQDLRFAILMEKASRPPVAKIITDLVLERSRIKLLTEKLGTPGNSILPEGFDKWEIETIFEDGDRMNRVVTNLIHRDRYINKAQPLIDELNELRKLLNDDTLILAEIKKELQDMVASGKYRRKSVVKFISNKETKMTYSEIVPQVDWDKENLPVSIFYDRNHIIKNYGRNCYSRDFKPIFSINCTNHDELYVFYDDTYRKIKASEIPPTTKKLANKLLRGVIPVPQKNLILIYTNKNRFKVIDRSLDNYDNLDFLEDELIIGWEYMKSTYDYFDIRSDRGVQRVSNSEFKYFSNNKFRDFWSNIGRVVDIIGVEIVNDPVNLYTKLNDTVDVSFMLEKTRYGNPSATNKNVSSWFTPHIEFYVDKMYVFDWEKFDICYNHTHKLMKKLSVPEYAYLNDEDELSKRIYSKLMRKLEDKVDWFYVKTNYTESYMDWDKSMVPPHILDTRLLEEDNNG